MDYKILKYSIWIEAEEWASCQWDIVDSNSDVVVRFSNGEEWGATFFTYKNIFTLRDKNRRTGECLEGKYFCATNLILVTN
jgi:hypothetical protein